MYELQKGEKFWIGQSEDGKREIFAGTKYQATPEETGYETVEGPFDDEDDAKECL